MAPAFTSTARHIGFRYSAAEKYSDPITETFVNDRLTFLEKTAISEYRPALVPYL